MLRAGLALGAVALHLLRRGKVCVDSASSSEADDSEALARLPAKQGRRPALQSIRWGKPLESPEEQIGSISPRLAAIRDQQDPHSTAASAAQTAMPASPVASAVMQPDSPTSPNGSHAASQNTLPRPHTAQAQRTGLPFLRHGPPPESPTKANVPRSPGSTAAQGLNSLLLGGGSSSASPTFTTTHHHHQRTMEDLSQAPTSPVELHEDFGRAPLDPAAIRAAAAELADKVMADGGAHPSPAAMPYSPAAVRPAAGVAQADDNVLALKLTVVSGPSTDASYVTAKDTRQVDWHFRPQEVIVGRLASSMLMVDDAEVSGTHLILRWLAADDGSGACWQVADAGSLNGTLLNGTRISLPGRRRSAAYRLNSDDLLQLGTSTAIKVAYLPRELLEHQLAAPPRLRTLSGVNAPPPPIQRTPSRDGIARAPSISIGSGAPPPQVSSSIELPDLRITGYALSRVGREHERRSQTCEDVIRWVPDLLPGAGLSGFARLSSSARRTRAERALMRTTTCEASPALQQFLAALRASNAAGESSSPPVSSPSTAAWFSTAERSSAVTRTAAQTDKWPAADVVAEGASVSSPATEPASSARQSLDEGAAAAAMSAPAPGLNSSMASGDGSGRMSGGDEQPLAALFCVFDGHCGRLAAEQAAQLLPRELADRIDPRQLLQRHAPNASVWEDAFSATDQGLECEDGCTATAVLAWQDEAGGLSLQAANVGDSSGIWIPAPEGRTPKAVALTSDHRWTSNEERARLAGMGIQLEGRTRLYGLNLSRCLGDKFLKDEDLGLSCQPSTSSVLRLVRGGMGGVLVIASDGLWDVTDHANVVDVVLRFLPDGPQAAAEALLQLAHAQRSRDDISIVLLHIQP